MVIAVPTGIKIFSWLLLSFSKKNMTSRIIEKNKNTLNLLERFSRSNKNYFPINENNKELVVYGSNFSITINYPPYTSIVRYMVNIPYNLQSLIIGILISDGWLQINKAGNTRLSFKQSLDKFEYFWFVFNKLSHYCSSLPYITKTKIKDNIFYGISFTTRSYPCFTEYYNILYDNNVKTVPLNLYNLINYEVFAHWIMCDGTRTGKGITLQTQSFSIKEVAFIISILNHKFDLNCNIHMQRNKPTIYISTKSMKKIQPYILPYFCKSMRYKLFL